MLETHPLLHGTYPNITSIFSDEVQIGPDNVMTTLYTAKKYAVPALGKQSTTTNRLFNDKKVSEER